MVARTLQPCRKPAVQATTRSRMGIPASAKAKVASWRQEEESLTGNGLLLVISATSHASQSHLPSPLFNGSFSEHQRNIFNRFGQQALTLQKRNGTVVQVHTQAQAHAHSHAPRRRPHALLFQTNVPHSIGSGTPSRVDGSGHGASFSLTQLFERGKGVKIGPGSRL